MALNPETSSMTQIRTAGYRPPLTYRPTFANQGLPAFTLQTVECMRRDPQVQLGMAIKAAPYHRVKLTLKGDPEVTQFMASQIKRFWQRAIPKIINAFWYTLSAGEISYKVNEQSGRYEFWQYTEVYPNDVSILSRNLIPVGLRVQQSGGGHDRYGSMFASMIGSGVQAAWNDGKPIDLLFPKGFIYIHRREFNALTGRSDFEAAYESWLEKTDFQGAKHSRKLWFFKNAFGGGIMLHPEGNYQEPGGRQIPYRDLARQAMESAANGAVWCFENKRDPITGNPLWEYIEPKINGGGSELLEYVSHLDNEIMRGLGIPDDVIQQTGGGGLNSGAGRTIPLTAFLISQEAILDNLFNVCDEQVFRPLCKANFGHDYYEATVDVDIDSIMGTINPEMAGQQDENPEGQQYQDNAPTQMSGSLTTTASYFASSQNDPLCPHVKVTLLDHKNQKLSVLADGSVVQMSAQHLSAGKVNKNRSGKVSKGGQFTDGSGSNSTAKKKPAASAKPKAEAEAISDPNHPAVKAFISGKTPAAKAQKSPKLALTGSKNLPKQKGLTRKPVEAQEPKSEIAQRAKESHVMISAVEQRYAESVERQHAHILGGVSFTNSEAADIVIPDETGAIKHLVEFKTIVLDKGDRGRERIDMNKYAQVRKVMMEKKNKGVLHTVIADDRGVYGSNDQTKRVYYYRRGASGSARLSALHKCESFAELKKLMNLPEGKLPEGAKRTDTDLLSGTWKPTVHPTDGRKGFANAKTGDVAYAKK